MKWIWNYTAVCVYGTTGWKLLLGEVACSRCLAAWYFKLPNTYYAHKTSEV